MLLLSRQHPQDASKQVRIFEPARRLAQRHDVELGYVEDLWDGRTFPTQTLTRASALFLHVLDGNIDAHPVHAAVDAALVHGVPVVVDTDDDYFVDADHGPFDEQLRPHLSAMRALLSRASVVTVTGSELQERMTRTASDVRVIPNVVETSARRPRRASRLRIGFAGGPTHLRDLRFVLPSLTRLQATHDVDFVLFGLYDRDMTATLQRARELSDGEATRAGLEDFVALARDLSPLRFAHVPSVSYDKFLPTLAALDLDIGLCPLHDTSFNRCRSTLKYYQYAAVGTLAVCSDVPPYRGHCLPVADNRGEGFLRILSELCSSEAMRVQTERAQAEQWAAQGRFTAVSRTYEDLLLGASSQEGRVRETS